MAEMTRDINYDAVTRYTVRETPKGVLEIRLGRLKATLAMVRDYDETKVSRVKSDDPARTV